MENEVYMYIKNDVETFLSITVTDMQLRMKKGGALTPFIYCLNFL